MKYMGSKARIARYILPIILENRKKDQWYVEPFVGGANMIDKVTSNRIGGDSNEYAIGALQLIKDHPDSLPKDQTETDEVFYKKMKKSLNVGLKGYYGFALSYGGKWFGGWCRDSSNKRDYVAESYRSAIKQSPKLKGVFFFLCNYAEIFTPPDSIIYCDPPYKSATTYKGTFNHVEFWEWCREKVRAGHKVFISEYIAPNDFKCVWSKEINSSLTRNTGSKKGIERLFVHNTQLIIQKEVRI